MGIRIFRSCYTPISSSTKEKEQQEAYAVPVLCVFGEFKFSSNLLLIHLFFAFFLFFFSSFFPVFLSIAGDEMNRIIMLQPKGVNAHIIDYCNQYCSHIHIHVCVCTYLWLYVMEKKLLIIII